MNTLGLVIIMSLVAIIIAGFFILFVAYYNKKQSEQGLALQIKETEFQQMLLLNSLEVQEAERRRIARDLHDEVGVLLSVTKMSFNGLGKKIKDENLAAELVKSRILLDDSIATVRKISKELTPTSLENFGLVAAVEDFLNRIKDSTKLNIHFDADFREDLRFSAKQELMLYRIIQELTNNVIKHANANELEVRLTHKPAEELKLVFFDNGIGFNFTAANAISTGLGLRNIQSRVNVIKGNLSVISTPETGSRFNITVPLEAANEKKRKKNQDSTSR